MSEVVSRSSLPFFRRLLGSIFVARQTWSFARINVVVLDVGVEFLTFLQITRSRNPGSALQRETPANWSITTRVRISLDAALFSMHGTWRYLSKNMHVVCMATLAVKSMKRGFLDLILHPCPALQLPRLPRPKFAVVASAF